jgi:hypothetical protein
LYTGPSCPTASTESTSSSACPPVGITLTEPLGKNGGTSVIVTGAPDVVVTVVFTVAARSHQYL